MTNLFRIPLYLLRATTILASCASNLGIQKFAESYSNFNEPPVLINNNYPTENMYRN